MAQGAHYKRPGIEPPPPEDARFDAARNRWTLSRYPDVYAALRDPGLVLTSADDKDVVADASLHAKVQADLACITSAEWQFQMVRAASALIHSIRRDHYFDLVKEMILPWSVYAMLALNEVQPCSGGPLAPEQTRRITDVAGRLFYKTWQPRDPSMPRSPLQAIGNKWFASRGESALRELDRLFERRLLVLSRPMFTGLTQTLPAFLARSWVALLRHPDQQAKLLAEPGLMPRAVEELLRFAGTVHTRYRKASTDVRIGDAYIREGQTVALKLGSANRDPARFEEPDRLDISRRPSGHLGLGTGLYACAGAVIVRSAFSVVTPLFLAGRPMLNPGSAVVWTGDSATRWPRVVSVRLSGR